MFTQAQLKWLPDTFCCFASAVFPLSYLPQSAGCCRILDEELLGRLPQKPTDGKLEREREVGGERKHLVRKGMLCSCLGQC